MTNVEKGKKQEPPNFNKISLLNWYKQLSDDNKVLFGIIVSIVAALFTAWLTTITLWQYQNFLERKSIATGVLIDIQSSDFDLTAYSNSWLPYTTHKKEQPPPPAFRIYPENGVYNFVGKDLYKLNPNLAGLIHKYYINLISAEYDRQFLINHYYMQDIGALRQSEQSTISGINIHLYEKILNSTNLVPEIVPELNQSIESKFFFFF
jgi:hypothetical protein